MAVHVSQRRMAPLYDLSRYSDETAFGYHDGIALLNKVVKYGDAPEGEFQDLLSAPYEEPLESQ